MILVCYSFEATPNLHVHFIYIYRLGGVEEARSVSDLDQAGLVHRVSQQNAEDLVHGDTVLATRVDV